MNRNTVSIFDDPSRPYQADRCLSLKQAQKAGKIQLHALARGEYPGKKLLGNTLKGLRSIGYWDALKEQSWGLDWHRNDGIEFVILERGRCPFATTEMSHELTAGNFTVTRPWQPHRLGSPHIPASRLAWVIIDVKAQRPNQNWKWPSWVHITPQDLKRLTEILRGNEQPVLRATTSVQTVFKEIMQKLEDPTPTHLHSHLTVLINELLLAILEMLEKQPLSIYDDLSSSKRTVRMFLQELSERPDLQSHPWSVDLMAERCGLKPHRFTQLVKQQTNLAPVNFLNQCRLETTKKLLKETSLPISQISKNSGFSTSQYFSSVFKKFSGMTPHKWKMKHIDPFTK